jgi:hypothetical protein
LFSIFLYLFSFLFQLILKFGLIYGVALHLNSFSGSSSESASESVVQSFEEESVVQSDKKLTDEFSNKRLDTTSDSAGSASLSKGETGKYGVETMLTVSSPFMSQIGENVT